MTVLGSLLLVVATALLLVWAFGWFHKRRRELTRTVYAYEHGLLYEDGRFVGPAAPGRYWTGGFTERLVVTLPKRPLTESAVNVDVTSADGLCFRLSGTLAFTVADPHAAHEGAYREQLRLALTDALVRLAAGRPLEALLSERASLGEVALALVPPAIAGGAPTGLVLTGINLPPDLRRLFSEVERARREGQAALERARGEQAALRSLANAARMLKGNPELMNLRLLQSLSASGNRGTLVLGRDALDTGAARPDEPASVE